MNKASRTPSNDPQGAGQGPPRPTGGEPKNVARKGVLSAVGSDPQTVTVTGITPGLQIQCQGVPVADWLCACGEHERARGRAAVIALQARVIVGICPHTTTEGRAAS
ncbi:hypothetical protein [Streptomyces scabiei]|uniref:hypothetical protein n=1 Tax=Streptomyces scabiei TaxID=1930 RepID=UPI000629BA29|nr:hypothetical protein [Streptomyces scabiei]MDX2834818.1 hypothetical protein [Streptomyces scabiei]MDX3675431.1 hypothetical protein [Streptomyces scabiei]